VEANGLGGVGIENSRHYFKQIAEGMSFLHRNNVVHLDLSLENVLLTADYRVKICDFGVARVVPPDFRFNVLSTDDYTGTRPGKIAYMAPEVFASEPYSGKAADVFTLGVDLFILLTGVSPYSSPTPTDQRFHLIVNGHLDRLLEAWQLTHLVPPGAIDLLTHMLAPENRRFTVEQVLAHPWLQARARVESNVDLDLSALNMHKTSPSPSVERPPAGSTDSPCSQGSSGSSLANQVSGLTIDVGQRERDPFSTEGLPPATPISSDSESDNEASPPVMTVNQWLEN
jgi:serine/threonine protein kinase